MKKHDEVKEAGKTVSAYAARHKCKELKPGNALSGNRELRVWINSRVLA